MGERFLDDLARALARPMPRRRALRLVGVTLAAAAIPSLRSERARAWLMACPGEGMDCSKEFREKYKCRCPAANGCYSYRCCASPSECFCDEEEGGMANCCRQPYAVEEGKPGAPGNGPAGRCESCPGARLCGGQCCKDGEVCRNEARKLCCVKAWKTCDAGPDLTVKCCPPSDTCCFKSGRPSAKCCSPSQTCNSDTGECVCKKKGDIPCGPECCDKSKEVCSSTTVAGKTSKKCCPRGKMNCGGTCCKSSECCGGKTCCKAPKTCAGAVCCSRGEVNCGGKCCTSDRCCSDGEGGKTCCPKDMVCMPARVPVRCCRPSQALPRKAGCCPPGTRPVGDVACCADPDCSACQSPEPGYEGELIYPLQPSVCVDGDWVPL